MYLEIMGHPMLIINDAKIAFELLEKRSNIHSSRPTSKMISLYVPCTRYGRDPDMETIRGGLDGTGAFLSSLTASGGVDTGARSHRHFTLTSYRTITRPWKKVPIVCSAASLTVPRSTMNTFGSECTP